MNKKILLIAVLLFFCGQSIFPQCFFIEKIQEYNNNVKIIHSNLMNNDHLDSSTFNVNTYMRMYSALKPEKKRNVFAYHYFDYFHGGEPHIYVKNKRFNLIKHINKKADKIKLKGDERSDFIQRSLFYFLNDSCNKANKNIFPEDTEEGYIQYLYFCEFGELFALKWHASYKSKQVICTKEKIENVVKKYTEEYADSTRETDSDGNIEDPFFYCDTAALQNLLLSDPIFSIQFNVDNVIIKWLELKKWGGGIFERSYKIMRTKPYRIELIDEKRLVEFQYNAIL